ncbi:uncharacterized protein LOC117570770 [Drosophila albomicans]|uniref:Uncharacterized protein LOC117570770 n=1 Tax=Drosophila albomicans TaxID=7291 RepID=A0A6P8YR52_DROAB|nr:uncharacterized protein LOC117570770 [Drosophila albomicans]
MKVSIVIALIASFVLAFASARPQFERGSIFAPSGRFAMTQNWASPPVDLSKGVVFLPEATPITEPPQEPKLTPTSKTT